MFWKLKVEFYPWRFEVILLRETCGINWPLAMPVSLFCRSRRVGRESNTFRRWFFSAEDSDFCCKVYKHLSPPQQLLPSWGFRYQIFCQSLSCQQYLIQMWISGMLWRNRFSCLDPHHVKYCTPPKVTYCPSKAVQCTQSLAATQNWCIIWWYNPTSSQHSSFNSGGGLPQTII